MRRISSLTLGALALVLSTFAFAACGSDDSGDAAASSGSTALPSKLVLGYFPNVTHAPAVSGVARGTYEEKLGSEVELDLKTFNAGPAAIEALFAGEIDATFVGPNPAI